MAENIVQAPASPRNLPAEDPRLLLLAPSPHIASPAHTRWIMLQVLIALAPVTVFGVILYGLRALLTIIVSVAGAVAAETLFRWITKRDIRVTDLSAAVTGLLLALILPPSTPLWMTVLGAFFAVIVAKEFFGGLGANIFNPALSGRAFLLMSFPAALTAWHRPAGFSAPLTDAVSAATPLAILRAGGTIADLGKDFFNAGLAASADKGAVIRTLFTGSHAGCIGESSILLILAGAFYLLVRRIIDWRAPLAMSAAAFLGALVLGMDPLIAILSGGVLFGAVFMATDYVSAPVTPKGRLVFGFGAGLITILIRKWGNYPEGVTYGILIMNAVTPFLNRLLNRKYGFVPKAAKAPPPERRGVSGMLRLGAVLALYASAACAGLALVYSGTAEIIKRQEAQADNDALLSFFPEMDSFEKIDSIEEIIPSPDPLVQFEAQYVARRGADIIGAAIRASRGSYGGPITVLTGVSAEGAISGVKILAHKDTPGLGANAASPSYYVDKAKKITFYGQFAGKSAGDPFQVKEDVAAITASTITSRAVAQTVKASGAAAGAWLSGGAVEGYLDGASGASETGSGGEQ